MVPRIGTQIEVLTSLENLYQGLRGSGLGKLGHLFAVLTVRQELTVNVTAKPAWPASFSLNTVVVLANESQVGRILHREDRILAFRQKCLS